MNKFPNAGSLNKIDEKYRSNPKSPAYRGSIVIGEDLCDYIAQEYRAGKEVTLDLSAWVKQGLNGNKFFSIAVQKHFEKTAAAGKPEGSTSIKDMEDDVPF